MLIALTSIPRLTHVDPAIFTLRYFGACMDCSFCHDACCQHGCDVDLGEREGILAVAAELAPKVATPLEGWFTTEVQQDPEFPSGQFVRTQVVRGACVFLNRGTRGCAIHALALATGRDYHQLKPAVCWLFPITWDQKVLKPSSDVRDGLICAGKGVSLYSAARDELRVVFGEALIGELDALDSATAC